jgi:hypothetical protein
MANPSPLDAPGRRLDERHPRRGASPPPLHPGRGFRWREHSLVLGAYTLLALVFTYPLVLHFGDAIAGVPGDVWSYVWAMGWARTSLDLGVNPFRNDYVYYPLGGATQLLWATALPSFASVPLQLAFGLIPAFNLMYLAATVLTGYGTYLLAKYMLTEDEGRRTEAGHSSWVVRLSSFVAGLAFAFCALRLGYGLAFANLYHTELIPFYILFLLKTGDEPRWRNAIFAGILLGLNAYIDFQIAAFLVLFTALWFAVRLIQLPSDGSTIRHEPRKRVPGQDPKAERLSKFLLGGFVFSWLISALDHDRKRRAWHLVAKTVVVAVIAGLVAAPIIAVVAQDLAAEGGNYIRVYPLTYSAARSYDVLAYVLPNARSTLYRLLPAPHLAGINAAVNVEGESPLSPDRQSFLGLTVLALAVIGALKRPRARALWIVTAVFFALLSFGPTLHVAGQDLGIPLPYALLHQVPIANHIRIPMRYGIMVFLCAALLAGAGIQVLTARVRLAPLIGMTAALVLAESAVLPYPTLDFSIPRVYQTIAAQPGDFTVLEIPTFNWRAAAATEVYQAVHQKRLLRVYTNRSAPALGDYFGQRQTPVLVRSLRLLEGAEDGSLTDAERATDQAVAAATLRFFKLRYAVLHRAWLTETEAAQIDQYLRETLGARQVYDEGTVAAYEFDPPAPAPSGLTLDLSSDAALMYLGRGWQTEPRANVGGVRGRFLAGAASELYFDLPAQIIRFRAFSEKSGIVLQCEWNERRAGALQLKAGWADYVLTLPADASGQDMNVLRLLHPATEANSLALSTIEIH